MSSTDVLNIGTYLTRSAEQVPERLAVAQGELHATYAEEELRVNAFSQALKALGLAKGNRVAIVQWNCRQSLETLLACFKAAFCIVPIHARLHPEEVRYRWRTHRQRPSSTVVNSQGPSHGCGRLSNRACVSFHFGL